MPFSDQMTPEEIQQTAQALHEAFVAGEISAEAFNEGMNDCNKGVRNYTASLKESLNQLGTSAKSLGESMLKGDTGMSQYNDIVNSGGNALAKSVSKYGAAGQAAAVLIKILTFGFSQVSAMSDGLYKANQDLNKAGAAGKEGMTGIFENMQKFGYGIDDLNDMTALITKNAQSLGQFSGSVAQGTNTLANMAKSIKTSDLQRQFMNMGMSVNDINKGVADYVNMQSSLGIQSNESAEEQARSAAAYIKQQDLLTKMTGQSADALQKNQAEAQQVEAWNAKMASMKPEEAAKYQAAFDALRGTSKTAAMGFAASITGMTGMTKEAGEAFQMTGGAITGLTKQFKENIAAGMDSNKAGAILKQGMADAAAKTQGLASSVAMVGGSAGMGSIIEHQKMTALAGGKVMAAFQRVSDAQEGQAEGYDENTNEQTKLRQQQMASRDSAQSVIEKGIGPATKGMAFLASLINQILDPFVNGDIAAIAGAVIGGALGGPAGALLGGYLGKKIGASKKEDQPGGGKGMSAADLTGMGLNIKKGDVQKEGATIDPKLIALAKQIQGGIPGFTHFNSFNDAFHNEKSPTSQHTKGLALDFALASPPSRDEGAKIVSMLQSMGASGAIDEYNNASAKSTGGHIHAQVSAKDGAILSGSQSGYKPNLLMHGTEAIVPMDKLDALTAGKSGYSTTSITSARSNVPVVDPFDQETPDSIASNNPSAFDLEMLRLDEEITETILSNIRILKSTQNARV